MEYFGIHWWRRRWIIFQPQDHLHIPTIIRAYGLRFFFYAHDHEPIHIHVSGRGGKGKAKIEVFPQIKIISSSFSRAEMRKILEVVIEEQDHIIESWNDFFREDA